MSIESQIDEAVRLLGLALEEHPERDLNSAEMAAMRGESRQWPCFILGRPSDPDAGEKWPKPAPPPRSPEETLLVKLREAIAPLEQHNPIRPALSVGPGPGTLIASFGLELDPHTDFTPRGHKSIDQVLAEGPPDPETSGVMPQIREEIETIRDLTPEWIGINLPNIQGPVNIVQTICGEEAYLAPLMEPEKFNDVMTLITDFFIEAQWTFRKWIGETRYPDFPARRSLIALCSANMMAEATYREHILPHDRRAAEAFGEAAIHPCSGPHLFRATLEEMPNMVYTEAGHIEKTTAGCIEVDDALALIGERPITLQIGQELPEGEEEAFIQRDFDRARTNPRLLFNYTGMHWKKGDEPMIRDLHLRLDEYWAEHVS